ncbi:MAG: STAS domain-containing protein [Clostridia bacterium]|nr:STAS domain-containing protein [Clostridia bacterium]
MNINSRMDAGTLCVSVEGRLDTMTAPELEAALGRDMPAAEQLVLDFSKLDYISSAGLRVLLAAHKTMSRKGGMKVIHVNEIVKEVFDVTGFSDILTVE